MDYLPGALSGLTIREVFSPAGRLSVDGIDGAKAALARQVARMAHPADVSVGWGKIC